MKIQKIEILRDKKRWGEKKRYSPKMYIFIENENVMDNLVNRRNRPYTEYKKQIIPEVMNIISKKHPEVFERIKDVKWGWDKNCGCSGCPCSPGFIGAEVNYEPIDIYVTI